MIDLYYWPTPNGHKVTLFLEEAGLAYTIKPVNIGAGDQFKPAFLEISPNNKMPAIVDHDAGGQTVFESGAILIYLAEKTGKFLPASGAARIEALEWLMWQMGGFGPMLGQNFHFRNSAPDNAYGVERYGGEAARLFGVLDKRLAGRDFVAGDYSIADMAIYPWANTHAGQDIAIETYPEVARWLDTIAARPATAAAYAEGDKARAAAV